MQAVFAFLGLPPYRGDGLKAEAINPTLLLPQTDVFTRAPRGPLAAVVKRFPARVLPRFGRQNGGGLPGHDRALQEIKARLDQALSLQYEELAKIVGKDVSELWVQAADSRKHWE